MADSVQTTLKNIYQDVTKAFEHNDSITVSAFEGNPPDKYSVTYRIPSIYKDSKGDICESDKHEIIINIPIGFPHFPPSCKPKTPIYHPDFDPSAICIGNYWKQSKSLVDLIHYIGKMISGEIYSTDNAFNSDAVNWYIENQHRLPFTKPDQTSTETLQIDSDDLSAPDIELGSLDIDTLGESDFNLEIDYLDDQPSESSSTIDLKETGSSEEEDVQIETLTLESEEPTEEIGQESVYDIDRMNLLLQQKRLYELHEEIESIRNSAHIENQESILETIENGIAKAKQLYRKGKDFEDQGLAGQALQCYQDAESFVCDYPDITDGIERVTASLELLSGETIESVPEEEYQEEDLARQEDDETKKPEKTEEQPVKLTFFDDKKDVGLVVKILRFVIPLCLLGLIVFIVQTYLSINSHWKRANELTDLCQKSLLLSHMSQVRTQCNQALENLELVRFLHRQEKEVLRKKISDVLVSINMAQSASPSPDKVYLSKAQKEAQLQYENLLLSAEKRMKQSDWQGAVDEYKQALKFSQNLNRVEENRLLENRKNLRLATIHNSLQKGYGQTIHSQWDKALDFFTLANKLLEQKSSRQLLDETTHQQLTSRVTVLKMYTLAQKQMQQSKWSSAYEHLNKAASLTDAGGGLPSELLSRLNKDITKVKLYHEVGAGKAAFNKKQWGNALNHYRAAIRLLKLPATMLPDINSKQYEIEISRIILKIIILQHQQTSARLLKKKQFDQSLQTLNSLIKTIQTSRFSSEEKFKEEIEEIQQTIEDIQYRYLVATGEEALKQNYQTLFVEQYPGTTPRSLSKVKITFVERRGDELLYNIQCVKSTGGGSARLVLDYFYNVKTKEIRFYSGQ